MQFVENAIEFFEKIGDLTRNLYERVFQNEDDSEYDFSFIAEPAILDKDCTAIISYVFNLIDEKEKENEDKEEKQILSYSNLVKLSKDNKKYYGISEEFHKLIIDLLENGYTTENLKLYICDITETFYTEINNDNKAYFLFRIFHKITIEKEVSEDYIGRSIYQTFCYEWDSSFFNDCALEEYFDIDDINGLTVINISIVENDGYEEIECAKRPLQPNEIWDEPDFIDIEDEDDEDDDYNNIPYLVKMKKSHKEFLNSLEKDELILFGKTYTIDKSDSFSDKMNTLASFVHAYNQGFGIGMSNSEWDNHNFNPTKYVLQKCFKEITEIWYGENLEKEFDIENVHINITEALKEYELVSSMYTKPLISGNLKYNPSTYFLYDVFDQWKGSFFNNFFDFSNAETSVNTALSFPSMKYILEYIQELEEFCEQVNQAQNDIDDFDLGLVGGGFGIGGAIKGILAASFLNAATKTAYTAYKAAKLKPKEQEKRLEEFTNSPKTKAYICELIIIDMKLMFVKYWDALYNITTRLYASLHSRDTLLKSKNDINAQKRTEFFSRALGVHNLKGLLDSYTKSYKLYSIALAKYLDLSVMPVYEDMEQYYDMSPLELIENAIMEFPYDGSYYQKYKEFGGEITDDLKTFAALHMNDEDDLLL